MQPDPGSPFEVVETELFLELGVTSRFVRQTTIWWT